MKNFRWWPVIALAAMSAVLYACGSSSSSTSSVRVVNSTITHPAIDLLVDAVPSVTDTVADTVSVYVSPAGGATTLQINDTTTGAALSTTVPTLTGSLHYAVIAYESGGAVQTAVLNEDFALPAAGAAQLRIYNAAASAGKLDVYLTDPSLTNLSTVSTPTLSFTSATTDAGIVTESPADYKVWVTGFGNKADLRMVMTITLASQQFAHLVLTPASGGALLNGGFLIEQGAYTATRNTNARIRLAAAVSGGATVAASASTGTTMTTIDAGSVAPAFDYYVLVPAGTAQTPTTLNISVNGNSVGAPAATLTAGGDSTLLVYGTPTTAAASLLVDDNRPPADPTTVKLQLINGITGNVGALTLTANTSVVATGILPGMASPYVSVPGSANPMNLVLTSSNFAGILASNATNTLNANTVYTVMAAGDVSAPLFLVR